jgi:hypothetical protein
MTRMRHPLAGPDQRHVAERQPGCVAKASESHTLNERQDLARELSMVIDLA